MTHIFLLAGDYIKLGIEEVLSLFDFKNYKFFDRLLIVELKNNRNTLNKIFRRLALTKSIYKLLFECKVNDIKKYMKNFDWNFVYKDSFCLRINYINHYKNSITKKSIKNETKNNKKSIQKYSEENLAGYIWDSVRHPKVDLSNPKTKIELFIADDKIYCGLLIFENKENFEKRKAHLRPFSHPSSLHPKVARALVNITEIKEQETLLDPFCGTGGFLVEAALMKVKVIGYDISKNMIKGCKENLRYFRIKKDKIINKNALKINKKFDYAVTDLPYGLNSNVYLQYNKKSITKNSNKINLKIKKNNQIKNLEQFYLKFLKTLRKAMKKKAVVIFPSYVNYKRLLKASKFNIEREFSIYVHRSLARNVVKVS